MSVRDFEDDILIVTLPRYPQLGYELETATEIVSSSPDYDVLVDFSDVKMLTSESICNLMILSKLLTGHGHRLVLCGLSEPIRHIFEITGLVDQFDFAYDRHAALQALQRAPYLYT